MPCKRVDLDPTGDEGVVDLLGQGGSGWIGNREANAGPDRVAEGREEVGIGEGGRLPQLVDIVNVGDGLAGVGDDITIMGGHGEVSVGNTGDGDDNMAVRAEVVRGK